jgi:predicted membrane chloride channel (bestrophin family)
VGKWFTQPSKRPARVRPWWAWWPLEENETDDTLNMGLVSPGGSTVARLTTQEEWTRHRNPWRYFRALVALFQGRSTVLRRSAINLTVLTLLATALCGWNAHHPALLLRLDPLPFSVLGAFVSLLLVFRTNASYGRFCEARLLLGQLVLHTREFARLAVIHFPSYALRHKAMAYVSAFAWCLKARVRLGDRPEVYVSELLGPRETAILLRKSKPAFFALQELTKMVASCEEQLPDYVSIGLNTQLEHMDRVLGGCERIISTPIPLSYTRHTTRSLLIYLLGEIPARRPLLLLLLLLRSRPLSLCPSRLS